MYLYFTVHALCRMHERGITIAEVELTIKLPARVTHQRDKQVFRKIFLRGVIEAIIEITERHIKVITVYWV